MAPSPDPGVCNAVYRMLSFLPLPTQVLRDGKGVNVIIVLVNLSVLIVRL